ncbi:MAG: YtcA family lipoprotein [Candidatus Binatia bacterium]
MADRGQLRLALLLAPAVLGGCDPVFDIDGAFFPSWMVCLLAGVFGAVGLRYVFVRTGLEPHLGPLPLIYTCLTLLIAMVIWVQFFPV